MKIFRNNDDDISQRHPKRNDRHAAVRDPHYEEIFGPVSSVIHECEQHVPHIDVYIFTPETSGRDCVTMVTSGMSDIEMPTPAPLGNRCSRAELVFYCRDVRLEYANMLREIAHYPHDKQTWLGCGHTLQFGKLMDLGGKGESFSGYLFLPPPCAVDKSMRNKLKLDNVSVNLLWVVPVTEAERSLAETQGTGALVAALKERGLPPVFDPDRASCV